MQENLCKISKAGVQCQERINLQKSADLIDLVQNQSNCFQSDVTNLLDYNDFILPKVFERATEDHENSFHYNNPFPKNFNLNNEVFKVGKSSCNIGNDRANYSDPNNILNATDKIGKKNLTKYNKSVAPNCLEPVTLALNLGWGSDEDENEVFETRSFPTRFYLEEEILTSWETEFKKDKFSDLELDMCGGSEFLCEGNNFCEFNENSEVSTKVHEKPKCISPILQSIEFVRPSQFYFRKKNNSSLNHIDNLNKSLRKGSNQEQIVALSIVRGESEPTLNLLTKVGDKSKPIFSDLNKSSTVPEAQEPSLITPKKTNDITKIKGWRRKQFFVEKPTTVEFFSFTNGTSAKKIELKDLSEVEPKFEEPESKENAFVCDTLDEFLDHEAELKINYEIPHLYAEFGIKLTREEILSKPNLSQEDFKKVEKKYCVSLVSSDTENFSLDAPDDKKGIKRRFEENDRDLKVLRLEDGKKKSFKTSKQVEKSISETKFTNNSLNGNLGKSNPKTEVQNGDSNLEKLNLTSKLIGLVVYPGNGKPLHPIVRQHLEKLRSYRTKIDKQWANFAASAVAGKKSQYKNIHYKRHILPVFCCGKEPFQSDVNKEVKNIVEKLLDSVTDKCSKFSSPRKEFNECGNEYKNPSQELPKKNLSETKKPVVKLKNCCVIIDKIFLPKTFKIWCMDHNCYNCFSCGLNKTVDHKQNSPINPPKKLLEISDTCRKEIKDKNSSIPCQAAIDKTIGSLLAKKLRLLKLNGDILTSIDNLKTLTPNSLELIRLNFVKQSFLTGYINIWYLKPESNNVKSRAFLTFSKTSPFPNAINLKSSKFSHSSLPKVITEIVSKENTFDSNEFALLHCDGKIWEIHGCLNLAMGKNETIPQKSDKNVEQIFSSVTLPELVHLQKISSEILLVSSSKWWVLDLTQNFDEVTINSEAIGTVISRKKFLTFLKNEENGFIPIKKGSKGRTLGTFVHQELLPFVLIGPYYFLESSDLFVKADGNPVAFKYYGNENSNRNQPLKFFINSVISEYEGSEKRVEGLWLCDRMCLDNTCYLEVMMNCTNNFISIKQYNIDIEHGYSLNSLTNSSSTGSVCGIVKGDIKKESLKKIKVYLYFEIVELGYLEGELQKDNSVIINHPMNPRTRVKSHKIGDWFIGVIKNRIHFIPKDIKIKWFITKHKEDLRGRLPFNKFYLGGAHILCKNGLIFILQLTESKIEALGLDKNEVIKVISESKVMNEIKELKALSKILSENDSTELTMEDILTKAVNEIQKLKNDAATLAKQQSSFYREKIKLTSSFLKTLDSCNMEEKLKIKMIEKIKNLFTLNSGKFRKIFACNLRAFRFGRQFLRQMAAKKNCKEKKRSSNASSDDKKSKKHKGNLIIEKLEGKLSNISKMLEKEGNLPNSVSHEKLIRNFKKISNQINSLHSIFKDASGDLNFNKKLKKKSKVKKLQTEQLENGFIRLSTKQKLPKNVKVYKDKIFDQSLFNELHTRREKISLKNENLLKKKSVSVVKKMLKNISPSRRIVSSTNIENRDKFSLIQCRQHPNCLTHEEGSKKVLFPTKNQIVIIKNLKNDKTAMHKLNLFEPVNNKNSSPFIDELRTDTLPKNVSGIQNTSNETEEDDVQILEEIPKKTSFTNFGKEPL